MLHLSQEGSEGSEKRNEMTSRLTSISISSVNRFLNGCLLSIYIESWHEPSDALRFMCLFIQLYLLRYESESEKLGYESYVGKQEA